MRVMKTIFVFIFTLQESVLCVRLRGGVGPEFHGKYFADTNLYDFIDLYSV